MQQTVRSIQQQRRIIIIIIIITIIIILYSVRNERNVYFRFILLCTARSIEHL